MIRLIKFLVFGFLIAIPAAIAAGFVIDGLKIAPGSGGESFCYISSLLIAFTFAFNISKSKKSSAPPPLSGAQGASASAPRSSNKGITILLLGAAVFGGVVSCVGMLSDIDDKFGVIGFGGLLVVFSIMVYFSAAANSCPKCRLFWARKELSKERVGSTTKVKKGKQVDTHRNRLGTITGTTEREVDIYVDMPVFDVGYRCKSCGHTWQESKTEKA